MQVQQLKKILELVPDNARVVISANAKHGDLNVILDSIDDRNRRTLYLSTDAAADISLTLRT